MKPAGYLINTDHGQEGEPGLFFNYILAGNGLFVESESCLLKAAVRIADVDVRGLKPFDEYLELVNGKVPRYIYDLAMSVFAVDPYHEHYLAVVWNGEYHLKDPLQEASAIHIDYTREDNTMIDIHSHAQCKAGFSYTDDSDETGMQLYMVVRSPDMLIPDSIMRVGIHGYYAPVNVDEVFDVYIGK